ncbi:hypothetical protein IWQ62_000046 [Dispira parvispora]|uniref:Uncharacterized protein n=1 Tax=Dispira parvispora TaxID=1520584 RepID=A0A9W8AWP9_9FUNG|nr:hypothetical protein IWQ62_000046 [Dispira parvispora]
MKVYAAACLALFAAVAVAQDNTTEADNASSTAAEVPTYEPTPEQKCVTEKNCGDDMNCVASCYGVPNPSADQTNQTAECFKACPETGPADEVAKCRQDCIDTKYMPTGDGKPNGKATGTASGSKADSTSEDSEDADAEGENAAASLQLTGALALPVAAVAYAMF